MHYGGRVANVESEGAGRGARFTLLRGDIS